MYPGVRPGGGLARRELPASRRAAAHASRSTAITWRGQARWSSSPPGSRDAVRLVSEGRARSRTASVRIADDEDRPLPEGTDRAHLHMRGDNVTRGYFENPRGQRRGLHRRRLAAHRRSRRSSTRAISTSPDGRRRSSSSTARTTTRTTSRRSRSASRAWSSARWWPRACGRRAARDRAAHALRPASRRDGGFPAARHPGRAPHQRADGPRGRRRGAGQAHPEDDQRQDPAPSARAELCRGRVRRGAGRRSRRCARPSAAPQTASRSEIEEKLRTICDAALGGKRVDVNDNLFELGRELAEAHRDPRADRPGVSRGRST